MHRLEVSTLSAEQAIHLHQRLLSDDPTATMDCCVAYLDWLFHQLRALDQRTDEHHLLDAVTQTLLDFCKRPAAYDPAQLPLCRFLLMTCRRDLLNLLRKHSRQQKGRVSLFSVEDDPDGGNYVQTDGDLLDQLIHDEATEEGRKWLDQVSAGWTELEKRVLELMRRGEDDFEAVVRAMEIADWPREKQVDEVHKVKERITKRLKREKPPS